MTPTKRPSQPVEKKFTINFHIIGWIIQAAVFGAALYTAIKVIETKIEYMQTDINHIKTQQDDIMEYFIDDKYKN